MKKILAVMGSPRKGETYQALKRFEECLNQVESVEMEIIFLSQVALPDCLGCHRCISEGEDKCYQAERVNLLYEKMRTADGVILATPVYNQHVTALMKKFLDYLTYLWHRPAFFGKRFFGLSSGGGMFNPVFKFLKTNVESWGGIWAGELGVPHYESLTPKYQKKLDMDFAKKAQLFMKSLNNAHSLPAPGIGRLMMFNIWKMNARVCKESIPADFQYWTQHGYFDTDYYYPTRLGWVKKGMVKLMAAMARRFMQKVYVGY